MDYQFVVSGYSSDLLAQVARGLEKRTELESRAAMPRLWKVTDRLNALPSGRRRTTRSTLYGVAMTVVGIILVVPGIRQPKELLHCLLAGMLALVMGVLALTGKVRGGINAKYVRAAKGLLEHLKKARGMKVTFAAAEMRADGIEPVPYSAFSCAIETKDTFILVWGEQATILQKKDLKQGFSEQFLAMLEERSGGSILCAAL